MNDPKNLSLDEKRRLAKALLARKEAPDRERAADAPIAVVGIGCRYPGGVVDPESFWHLLESGRDAVRKVPAQRWDADALYDGDPDARGKTNTREGGFLEEVDRFDAAFFGLSPREAVHVDPQHRLLLETSWEALERAGIAPQSLTGTSTGVYVGLMWHDYEALRAPSLDVLDGHVHIGSAASIASGRLSYFLGLQGPSVTVDTACSSSLVTIHLACQALRAGECDLALAGGATLLFTPSLHVEFAKLHGLAPDGRCKSFSASADGVGWGEGCGMLVLKRLEDALRARDPIWGVIRGSAVNQDGRSNGITAPNGPAQEAVLRRALSRAGVASWDVDYVEAHGTGTALGDPIEARALASVYGEGRSPDRPLLIGSVKSNIGHSMAAAGVAGVIKVLLALRHGRLPASLHASTLSPHIPWHEVPLRVMREPLPWPSEGRPRAAGVSSFGISGTNAHLLVSEAPAAEPAGSDGEAAYPVFLSGKTRTAAVAQAHRLAEHLESHPELRVADIAHTLAHGRTHFGERLGVVASDTPSLVRALRAFDGAAAPRRSVGPLAFLCTGQGSQYAKMGHGLYGAYPAFREVIDACARALTGHLNLPLTDVLFGAGSERLDQTELTQPATFAIGVALDALWRSWGVVPQHYLGHSVGEYVAACAAGVFSVEDGARLVAARGRLMQSLCRPGAMLALDAPEERVAPLVEARHERVSIAAINGPRQTVIAGEESEVAAILEEMERAGVRARRLSVSHAFHSPLMQPMLDRFAEVARAVRYAAPRTSIVSNVTGATGADFARAEYWVQHVLAPVRFADGMRALHAAGARLFVELGAQPTLAAMGAACLPGDAGATFLPSLRKGRDDAQVALGTLCALWSAGAEIDPRTSSAEGRRVELPTYPFERERHFVEVGAPPPPRIPATGHPLLGARVPAAGALAVFESTLTREGLPWLGDHLVFDLAVMPGAALVEWAQAAGDAHFGAGAYSVGELAFEQPLIVPDGVALRAQVVLTESDHEGGRVAIAIHTQPATGAESWTRHAAGRLVPSRSASPRNMPEARGKSLAPETIYEMFAAAGLRYMSAFRAVRRAWRSDDGAVVAELALDERTAAEVDRYGMHPALFDAALHSLVLAEAATLRGELFLPVAFRDVRFGASGAASARVRGEVFARSSESIQASVTVWSAEGDLILEVGRMECKRVVPADIRPRGVVDDLLFSVEWKSLPEMAFERSALEGRSYLIGGGETPLSLALEQSLRSAGARVTRAGAAPEGFEGVDGVVLFVAAGGTASEAALGALPWAQAAARHNASAPRLLWVTERGQAVRLEDDVSPAASACWGLGRVLLVEQPAWSTSIVDVESFSGASVAAKLVAELCADDGESQVAWRGERRYAARLARAVRAEAAARPLRLADGPVLVTGGLGGIGLALARHLADRHGARHLVLMGRSAPTALASAAVEALRATGVRVEIANADVADRSALARVLEGLPPLRAVFHAAGTGDAVLLAQQTAERFSRTLDAKVGGAWNLHELTAGMPLEAFVLFSSIASVIPTAGPSAYATANAFLDGLAQHRRARGLVGQSVAFGPWAGTGMLQALAASEQQRLAQEGTPAMDPARALAGLDAAVTRDDAHLVVASIDLERRRRLHPSGSVPSLWRQLVRARAQVPRGEDAALRHKLDAAEPHERRAVVEALVADVIARAMSLPKGTDIPRDRPLLDLGVDSLVGIDVRNRLAGALRIELSATLIWEHRTVQALAAHLAPRLTARAPQRARNGSEPRPVARAIQLHPEPPYAPIFAIGGVLGGSTYLKDLATELGPLQPFFTMPFPGLEDGREPMTRVEDIAATLLESVVAERPHGPYVLLGHSFGGIVAFEMACRLLARGESVLELILLDTWTRSTVAQKKISSALPRIEDLLAPFVAAGHAPDDVAAYTPRFQRLWQANGHAYETYDVGTFAGDVTLIVPEDDLFGLTPNVEDWSKHCGTLKVRRTSGNHATMVLAPNTARTAQAIRGILRGPVRAARVSPAAVAKPAPTAEPPPVARATSSQRWMWLLHQLDPTSPRYTVFGGVRVSGGVDADVLERALATVVRRHESLRTSFVEADGEPRPVIHGDLRVVVARHDLSSLDGARAAELERIKRELTRAPFDLGAPPLLRVALVRLGVDEHVILACVPHVVADGLSFGLFFRELLACYGAAARGAAPSLASPTWQPRDYAAWQNEHLTESRREEERAFWRRTLEGLPQLQIPLDRQVAERSGAGATLAFRLDEELASGLRALARAEGCSLYMVLFAGFAALLARYGGQRDFAVATVVGDRARPEVQDTIGCFVNTMLVRFDLSGDASVREHLARARARVLEAMQHQSLPFDEVARAALRAHGTGGAPSTSACFLLQKALARRGEEPFRWERISDTLSADVGGTAKFDLTLALEDEEGPLAGDVVYATDVFDSVTIERLVDHYKRLLAAMVASPAERLARLQLLSDDERRRLLFEWNDTAFSYPDAPALHELFERRARAEPGRMAVVHGARSMTYGDLDRHASELAEHLRGLGVGREDCVGLCVERSIDMVVAMLAILKAGGAYVPLDPAYPRDRLRFMLEDSRARVVVVGPGGMAALGDMPGRRFVAAMEPDSWKERQPLSREGVPAHDLAYLIYTSGSTGVPKAVAIEHASAVELVRWALDTYPQELLDAVLASTSVCFDLSVFEIFAPLAGGGRIVLVENALELARLGPESGVRLVNTVPSAAAELVRLGGVPDSVRVMNLAGEPLPSTLVDAIYQGTRVEHVYDLYGPSEATTYATFGRREQGGRATIGRPIRNTRIYILDAEGEPVPPMVVGEIWVAGAGVARGYFQRPDLTAERFVPDPFVPGARMYRTGDLGRYLADGAIVFLGRTDAQIKLRGFRIELGEVEAALRTCEGVADCTVVVRELGPGDARLCAYVVGKTDVSRAEVLAHMRRTLPEHMLPQHLVTLASLPRTRNGKVDRAALPPPDERPAEATAPPVGAMEQTVAAVWQEVLHAETVGRDDHFFERGGHSLLAARAASLLGARLGRAVTPVTMFRYPVLRDLAAHLAGGGVTPRSADDPQRAAATQKQSIRQIARLFQR